MTATATRHRSTPTPAALANHRLCVSVAEDFVYGNVTIQRGDQRIIIDPYDVPHLIAALQAIIVPGQRATYEYCPECDRTTP